jgi:nucleoside-diphosphate-sugar epimerase
MKCLVTGHKGYIGGHLYRALKERGHTVMGIDSVDPGSGDIKDALAPANRKKYVDFAPEVIFHLACWPRVAFSVENPLSTMINNVVSSSVVLDFAKEAKSRRVIYSSSSSVVGNGHGPESPYALQKLTSEIETTLYSRLYGIDTVSLRYFNVYSADQKADGAYATAVANWMEYIRQRKNPFITGTGEQKRDMLNVQDVVSANIFAMEYVDDFAGAVYDTGTGTNMSLNKMKEICHEYFPMVNFEYVDPRPGDVFETQARPSSLSKLGWKTEVNIHDGIHECFKSLRDEINE